MSTSAARVDPRPVPAAPRAERETPPLEAGDRLTRSEFERRYQAMPGLKKAELLEGEVYMASPVSFRRHGEPHLHLMTWLGTYLAATPGVIGADNATTRLDLDNEPQPDAVVMIEPARGGQARISDDDYIENAPELVCEVATSSVSYDLHVKLNVYRRNGVREYVVWRVAERAIDWLTLIEGQYIPKAPDERGLLKSDIFPGLWLDGAALVDGQLAKVLAIAAEGVVSPEHSAFVLRLAAVSSAPPGTRA